MSNNSILVREVMSKEVISVCPGTTLQELLKKFKGFHTFPVVPVINKEGILIGTISFRNLIEIFQTKGMSFIKGVPFLEKEEVDIFDLDIGEDAGSFFIAQDIMDTKFLHLDEDMTLEKAYTTMKVNSVDRLPVTDKEGRLVGIIGIFDILLAIFEKKGIIK